MLSTSGMQWWDRLRSSERDWLTAALLVAVTAVIWCLAYGRTSSAAWHTPIAYTTDAWWGMATAKAVAIGDILPVLPKHPQSFGAPFAANWDDYPSTEEALLAWSGLLTSLFGVFAGANTGVLAAHLLAAAAFYYVCRRLDYERSLSFAVSLVFAFSRYAFSRGLLHLGLTYYWHVPLGLFVVAECVRARKAESKRRQLLSGIALAVLFGIQNVYYTWMFVQLLGLAAVWQIARGTNWRSAYTPLLIGTAAVVTMLLMNVDTFVSRLVNGPGGEVVARNYSGLELYALKPVEMLLPVIHRVPWLHNWARSSYYAKTLLIGEAGSPYLGVVAIAALIWLAILAFRTVARGENIARISHAWVVLWIVAYSIVGGINGVVGFAFELFRGTNRYSVFILAVLLLFLVRELTRWTVRWRPSSRAVLATALAGVALFDQVPPGLRDVIAETRAKVASDRAVATAVQAKLPRGAMIFQLPIAPFPEVGTMVAMQDYEHFRPFLFTNHLRYSYGSVKGRAREQWQSDAVAAGVPYLVRSIEAYGFAAMWIDRNGYADRGAALMGELQALGRTDVLASNDEFICLRLQPSSKPELPPEFTSGWYQLESKASATWRWSSGSAVVTLYNPASFEQAARITCELDSLVARDVDVIVSSGAQMHLVLGPDQPRGKVDLPVSLAPGKTVVRFETNRAAEPPGNGDPRKLAFRVWNFQILD